MRILTIHSDFIEFEPKKKAFKSAEEAKKTKKKVKECLVVFTAVEKDDERSVKKITSRYVDEIKNIALQVKVKNLVLYPYAHLSSTLSDPKVAEDVMKSAEKQLAKKYKVTRAPFGWYKSFNISCKGHPLSELSREIKIEGEPKSPRGKDEMFKLSKKKLNSQEKISISAVYVLAQALKNLYPKIQIGTAGFYHDQAYLDVSLKIKQSEFPRIEKEVNRLLGKNLSFKKSSKTALQDSFQKQILKDLGKGAVYKLGDLSFVPLFNSPFVPTSKIRAFKMTNIASAYWRNNAANEQLTRLYCVAFTSPSSLKEYFKKQEEAANRSHLKIGKEQNLFFVSDLVGPGLPLLAPNGVVIRDEILNFLWELHRDKGYQKVVIPHIAKNSLYKKSGHWDKFGDELFIVKGKYGDFVLKPMNCPHHIQIFQAFNFSYKDMPVRFFEPTAVYRDEKPGQLTGLNRVRSITQDDGHLFCRVSQIEDEVRTISEIILKFYKALGMEDYWVSLSVRGEDKSLYLGEPKVWQKAESALEKVAKKYKLPYKKIKGEAAFYGPKLDFMFKDALGREWQLATIQLDFNLPERFDLSFINEKNQKERPVMIHRAISGSLERFMSVLIEHFAGKFPLWLSPVQVKIISFNDNLIPYAKKVEQKLKNEGLRVSGDYRSETVQAKVRDAEVEKVPYIVVIGEKEKKAGTLAVRPRGEKPKFGIKLESFTAQLKKEIASKAIK